MSTDYGYEFKIAKDNSCDMLHAFLEMYRGYITYYSIEVSESKKYHIMDIEVVKNSAEKYALTGYLEIKNSTWIHEMPKMCIGSIEAIAKCILINHKFPDIKATSVQPGMISVYVDFSDCELIFSYKTTKKGV